MCSPRTGLLPPSWLARSPALSTKSSGLAGDAAGFFASTGLPLGDGDHARPSLWTSIDWTA